MQKLPQKKKTTKRKLDQRELELKNDYYRELLRFYEKNDISEEENNSQKIYNTNFVDNLVSNFIIIKIDRNIKL